METLRKQVRIAQRRLTAQRFCELLPWCWFATLLGAAGLIMLDRFVRLGGTAEALVAGAMGLGVLIAAGWTIVTRRNALEAALEIDRRFGLNERVSSALALEPSVLETPVAQALAADAERRVERLDVREQFRLRLGRRAWLPLLPAALAFAIAMLIEPVVGDPSAEATESVVAQKARIENSSKTLRQNLAQRRKQAEELGLKEASALFEKLERGTRQLAAKDSDHEQALVKLNDLAAELEKRRQQLGGSDAMREQLRQLGKSLGQGPADKIAEAIEKGDLEQAAEALNKLKHQLADGKLDNKDQEKLAQQMDQIAKKLQQAAQAQQQREDQLKEQIAQKRAAGKGDEANELERQLSKLAQRRQASDAMKKLGEQCEQCSQALQGGDAQQASEDLESLADALDAMRSSDQEEEMIDAALDQIADAKSGMGCQKCQGQGCPACQEGAGHGGLEPGKGMGDRSLHPQKIDDTAKLNSRVRQRVGAGTGTVTDLVEGPNSKGDVRQQIRQQFEAARTEATDPLTGQQLSRGQREHAKEYFDRLREGAISD